MSFRITSRHEGDQIVLRLAPRTGTEGQVEIGRLNYTVVAAAGNEAWEQFLAAATKGMADILTGKNTSAALIVKERDLN